MTRHGLRDLRARVWGTAIWAVMGFMLLNIFALIAAVAVNSLGTRWFGTWFPAGLTTRWYAGAWEEFALPDVLLTTMQVVFAVGGGLRRHPTSARCSVPRSRRGGVRR